MKRAQKIFNKVTCRLSTHYKSHFNGLLILPAGASDSRAWEWFCVLWWDVGLCSHALLFFDYSASSLFHCEKRLQPLSAFHGLIWSTKLTSRINHSSNQDPKCHHTALSSICPHWEFLQQCIGAYLNNAYASANNVGLVARCLSTNIWLLSGFTENSSVTAHTTQCVARLKRRFCALQQ